MHSAALRYFAVVARAGSIRRASDELHVAASAVSRQIRKIETELGMTLFERLPNGLRLTAAGRIVLTHAERTLHDFELLKGELGELKGVRTGVVSVASLDSLLVSCLPRLVEAYHRANPNVNFRVRSTTHNTIATLVAEGAVDIGITFNLPHPEDLVFLADVPMPLMAMVSRDHPLAGRRAVSLSDCAEYNLLLQLDTLAIQSMIEVELSVLQRRGRVLVSANNLLLLKHMIRKGLGVAFFTPIGMAAEIADGSVVGVRLSGTRLAGMRIGVMVSRRRRLTPAAEGLVDALRAELPRLAAAGAAAAGR